RSLGRLKAEVVQRAYEAATKTATTDELHNTNFSAVKWNDALNAIGMKKLTALFSKDEIAHLATVGRAARAINEAVPGTVNTSNTESKSANIAAAMANAKTAGGPSKLKTAVRVVGHPVAAFLHPLAPGLSNVALEGAVRGAEGLSKNAANKALAQAIQQTLDPQLARSAARTAITKETDQIRRAAMARQLSTRLAPAGGDQRGR
ncbi:MAG: hypothetical protein JF605_23340, partial [Burkholderia sp.]|nr:hypothetical protein [Burkholderia sp.]